MYFFKIDHRSDYILEKVTSNLFDRVIILVSFADIQFIE